MKAIGHVAADGAADNSHGPIVVDAASTEPALITVDRAGDNRQRPGVGDAAAGTHGEWIGHTSMVVVHDAVS